MLLKCTKRDNYMAISNINKSVCKAKGETNLLHCPSCKNEVHLQIFSTEDKSIFSKVLKISSDLVFAVCPQCSAVFSLSPSYIDAFEMGNTVFADESDLIPLK